MLWFARVRRIGKQQEKKKNVITRQLLFSNNKSGLEPALCRYLSERQRSETYQENVCLNPFAILA